MLALREQGAKLPKKYDMREANICQEKRREGCSGAVAGGEPRGGGIEVPFWETGQWSAAEAAKGAGGWSATFVQFWSLTM
jgi:hypothetical protein